MIRSAAIRTLASVACFFATVGCASWRATLDPAKVAAEREKYGATADQRIEELASAAARAKRAGPAEQAEYTRDLSKQLLGEHDPRVRAAILAVAAEFDTPPAAAICRGAVEDPEPRVRMAACEAWRKRGGPEAVSLLGGRVSADTDIDVRLKAVRELGLLEDEAAVPALARALEDPDPAIQYRAVSSLKQVSGRDLGDDVNAWRAWAADPNAPGTEWSIAEEFRKLF
jgi:HEAT repeat protein